MNTGTNWERGTFAGKIAERSGTAENLALGNLARWLKQSFIDAFNDLGDYRPTKDEGTGGKAMDRAAQDAVTPYEKAKSYYYAQQKKGRGRAAAREGVDDFATPEPVGFKMVEFANIRPGDHVLEPSAGHGAIARFFPEETERTVVEPSMELATRAALASPGARVLNEPFENHHIVNKYDAIVMNPPFGVGGKTAMEHLEKAMSHLRNGGRIVALLPEGGMADKRLEELLYNKDSSKGVYKVGEFKLPAATFEKAGTSVRSHIVVLERQNSPEDAARINEISPRDYTEFKDINELFDRMENASIPDRVRPKIDEAPAVPPRDQPPAAAPISWKCIVPIGADYARYKGSPAVRGDPGQPRRERHVFEDQRRCQEHDGYYSKFARNGAIPGFQFPSAEKRQAFLDEIAWSVAAAFMGSRQLAAATRMDDGQDRW